MGEVAIVELTLGIVRFPRGVNARRRRNTGAVGRAVVLRGGGCALGAIGGIAGELLSGVRDERRGSLLRTQPFYRLVTGCKLQRGM